MIRTIPRRKFPRHFNPLRPAAARILLEALEPRLCFSASLAPIDAVAQANNAFAFDLYKQLRKTNPGNIFFSPYSISTALEMALQGARGSTASEIIAALHLPADAIASAGIQALYQLFESAPADAGYTISTANRLWVSQNFSLLQSFLTKSQTLLGAIPQSVDFSDPKGAAGIINAWVSDQTHGKIKELIPAEAINKYTRLILANAVYFKGDWEHAFDVNGTHPAAFDVSPTQTSTVQMMHESDYFRYCSQAGPDGFQAIYLPYKGGQLDMEIILPNAATLDDFQSSLTPDLFSKVDSNFGARNVSVYLPQFTLSENYNLAGPLSALGIKAALTNGADFSGISNDNLRIDVVAHKSYINVDEKGTEAAAVTGISMEETCVFEGPTAAFVADHPFMFAIRDRSTGTILFMGQVVDPGVSGPTPAPHIEAPSDGPQMTYLPASPIAQLPPGTIIDDPVDVPPPPSDGSIDTLQPPSFEPAALKLEFVNSASTPTLHKASVFDAASVSYSTNVVVAIASADLQPRGFSPEGFSPIDLLPVTSELATAPSLAHLTTLHESSAKILPAPDTQLTDATYGSVLKQKQNDLFSAIC